MMERDEKILLEEISLNSLSFIYWNILNNVLTNYKYKNVVWNKYSLPYSNIFPFLIIKSTNKNYRDADDMIREHAGQLYQILLRDSSIDYSSVTSEAKNDALFPNITERRDVGFISSREAAILILTGNKLNSKRITLEALIILEIVQFQKHFNLGLIETIQKAYFSKVKLKIVNELRYYLSIARKIYEQNIAIDLIAKKRLDHGKDMLEIDNDFQKADKSMERLSEVLNNFYSLRTNFYQIALAVILGVVPTFTVLLPLLPILQVISAIGITFGIILIFYLLSGVYWARQNPTRKYEKKKS